MYIKLIAKPDHPHVIKKTHIELWLYHFYAISYQKYPANIVIPKVYNIEYLGYL